MNNKFKNVFTFGGFIIFVLVIVLFVPTSDAVEVKQEAATPIYEISDNTESMTTLDGSGEKIYVYILGAVHEPGVVEALKDSRLYEIIELASGEAEDADLNEINLARVVSDGEKIIIPYKNSEDTDYKEKINSIFSKKQSVIGANEGLININTADEIILKNLDGIGDSTAKKIIKYREENGKFKNIEDIKNVSGIGENKFNAIKDDITI